MTKINKCYSTNNQTAAAGRRIEYIVIHYTAGTSSKTGNALSNAQWFGNPSAQASADFVVDDSTIYQVNGDIKNRYCWAVGGDMRDGHGGQLYGIAKNSNCISIEICSNNKTGKITYPNDPNYYFTDAAVNIAAELTVYLMGVYGISADHVIRHEDVNGKSCPGIKGWNNASGDESKWKAFHSRISGGTIETKYYRVRKSWDDEKSQLGAYEVLDNAIANCPSGYSVYDNDGKVVYTAPVKSGTQATTIRALGSEAEKADALLEVVKNIAPSYSLFPSVITAQAILESGYCSTVLSGYNNVCGMKCDLVNSAWTGSKWDGTSKVVIHTPEEYNGKVVYIDDYFRVYNNIENCIGDICAFFSTYDKYVSAGVKEAKSYAEQIAIEKNCGYATDSGYVNKVISIIEKYGLDKYDNLKYNKEPEPEKETKKTNAEIILSRIKSMDKLLKQDNKDGKQWKYYNGKTPAKTFSKARSTDKRYVSCANGVIWVLQDSGVVERGTGGFYGKNGEIKWSGDAKERYSKACEIIHINGKKTVGQCISDGTVKGACVIMFQSMVHTMLYVSGKYFDAGHANCNGTGEGADFVRFINSSTPYKDQAVSYILRVREDGEDTKKTYYRVQVGAYAKKKNAETQLKKVQTAGWKSAGIEYDGVYYRVQTGSYEVEKNALNEVSKLKAKGFDAIVKTIEI